MSGAGQMTVRYDACVAALGWPDGRRTLIGHDSISVVAGLVVPALKILVIGGFAALSAGPARRADRRIATAGGKERVPHRDRVDPATTGWIWQRGHRSSP